MLGAPISNHTQNIESELELEQGSGVRPPARVHHQLGTKCLKHLSLKRMLLIQTTTVSFSFILSPFLYPPLPTFILLQQGFTL